MRRSSRLSQPLMALFFDSKNDLKPAEIMVFWRLLWYGFLMTKIPHFMTKLDPKAPPPPEVVFAMLLQAQRAQLDSLEKQVLLEEKQVLLEDENAFLKQKLYGASSEKRKSPTKALPEPMVQVFDEAVERDTDSQEDYEDANAALDQATSGVEQAGAKTTDNTGKPPKGRKPLPDHFQRVEVIHDLTDADKVCSCGCQLSKIGEDVSEQLDVIPAQLKVLRHVRYKYACRACSEGVKTAPLPLQPIPKGIPTAGLLAHVAVAKFDDHLPLYRQSEIWERMGVDISRSTLSSWVLKMGDALQPMIPILQAHMVKSGYVRADETTTQVLKEPGRIPTATSYMWLYMTGNSSNTVMVYEYQPTRKGDHACVFLKGFKGVLQTDGYSGYHRVTEGDEVIAAGCFAHARRKFHDVWSVLKKDGAALKALDIIGKLYDVERTCVDENASVDQIKEKRQTVSKPLCDALHTWLIAIKPKVPPKSPLAKAITYTLNQWGPLTQYLDHGHVSIDNNAAERQIRPFTIGRKNWLFMGSVGGAKSASVIYSLIETAKANGLNPTLYLTRLLEEMPRTPPDLYSTLLPWNMINPPVLEAPA